MALYKFDYYYYYIYRGVKFTIVHILCKWLLTQRNALPYYVDGIVSGLLYHWRHTLYITYLHQVCWFVCLFVYLFINRQDCAKTT